MGTASAGDNRRPDKFTVMAVGAKIPFVFTGKGNENQAVAVGNSVFEGFIDESERSQVSAFSLGI